MGVLQVVAINILVWGAVATYYYLLYRLKSSGRPVVWFGPKAFRNYEALLKYIGEQQDVNVRRNLMVTLWAHFALMAGLVATFVTMIVLEA